MYNEFNYLISRHKITCQNQSSILNFIDLVKKKICGEGADSTLEQAIFSTGAAHQ